MRTYPGVKTINRGAISCLLTLTGGGLGAAPTVSAPGGGSNLFESITRTAPGAYTLLLRQAARSAIVAGVSYGKSDYDTTPGRKRLVQVSRDVRSAKTLVLRVEDEGPIVDEFTDPPAAAAAGLKAATATTVAPQTVLASALIAGGKTELGLRPRNVTFTTAGGTPADAPATALITGTDINGDALTETVTIAQTATIANGVKAFKTITSIVYAAGDGTDATVSIGYGSVFGLSKKIRSRAGLPLVFKEISAGAVVTNGTFVAAATSGPNGTYAPASAPDGAKDYAIGYEPDGGIDLLATEFFDFELTLFMGT